MSRPFDSYGAGPPFLKRSSLRVPLLILLCSLPGYAVLVSKIPAPIWHVVLWVMLAALAVVALIAALFCIVSSTMDDLEPLAEQSRREFTEWRSNLLSKCECTQNGAR
jgi:hypothetical protein